MKLKEYIDRNYGGSQVKFAAAQGIVPQQVTRWLKLDFIVVGGCMYSKRRELK